MKINKVTPSIGKNKIIRDTAILASLLTIMNTTQSCKDKNAGTPLRINTIELSASQETETSTDNIKIDDNRVSFNGVFDAGDNPDWMRKNLKYSVEVNQGDDKVIRAKVKGWTSYGGDEPNNFSTEIKFKTIEEFNQKFISSTSAYIDSIAEDLQSIDEQYIDHEQGINDLNKRRVDNTTEISNKTEIILSYLKYNVNKKENNLQKNLVQKKGDEVSLPIERNGNLFDFKINKNETGIKMEKKNGIQSTLYNITLNGISELIPLSRNPLLFAQELTNYIEAKINVGKISNQNKKELFFGKCFEANQLLND